MPDERQLDRDALIAELAHTEHQSWLRQTARDRGVPPEQLGNLPTDDDRERAADSVAALERLGMFGARPRQSRVAVLRHPLVVGAAVAAISAVFASLLIPNITRVSQDRPKELELKHSILDTIATSSAEALTRGVALSRGDAAAAGGRAGEDLSTVYRRMIGTWRVNGAIIDAELLTYFSGGTPQQAWVPFKRAVEYYLQLESPVLEPKERKIVAAKLRDYLRSRSDLYTQVPWDKLVDGRVAHHWAERMQFLLLERRNAIMADIVSSPAEGFKHSPWSLS